MKFYYKYILLALVIVSGASCKKYLDIVPENVGTLEYAFRNRNEAENYLFTCYSYTQHGSPINNAAFVSSGEIVYPKEMQGFATGFSLLYGGQTSGSPILNYWDGGNDGDNMFKPIRMCNTMLANIDNPIDLNAAEKSRWVAEVKFLKAYYHFYLLRMYGPIPNIDDNLDINAPLEASYIKRQSVDSSVNYIVNLLDESAKSQYLPRVIENQVKELGRVTKSTVLSLKSEVLMWAASPLFNGNPDYANYKDKEGKNLFSTTVDVKKWQRAADACKAAIDEAEAAGVILYNNFTTPNLTLSTELQQVLTLQNIVTEKWELNPELIWCSNPTAGWGTQGQSMPILTQNSLLHLWSIPSGYAVPLATTDLFYTKNGVPINEDKDWNYSGRFELKAGDETNKAYIKKGYTTVNNHFNREPRFYADIAFDGGIWYGNGVREEKDAQYVQGHGVASFAGGIKNKACGNVTGYWPKKLVNYLTTHDKDGIHIVDYRIARIRLAGLYLWYAEALNEANDNAGARDGAIVHLDKVRERAGLKGVKESWTNHSNAPSKFATQSGLRQIIHQERRIELCFEGQIGWDLRRWKELQEVLGRPVQGWSISEGQTANYYRLRTVMMPVFRLKDYLWPIQDDNLVKNPKLVQTPYWQ